MNRWFQKDEVEMDNKCMKNQPQCLLGKYKLKHFCKSIFSQNGSHWEQMMFGEDVDKWNPYKSIVVMQTYSATVNNRVSTEN